MQEIHWLSLLIGALIGWALEWILDIFYWRRRYTRSVEVEAETRTQLVDSQAELETLRAQVAEYQEVETQLVACRNELEARIQDVERLDGDLVAAKADVDALQTELANTKATCQAQVKELNAALSAARDEISTLRTQQASRVGSPSTARAAAAAGVTAAVVTGAERDTKGEIPLAGDDLTIIEGIGPKIADLLNQHGIRTFAELGDTDVERLRDILKEGGPGFHMADPETWPRQARLAAKRDWVALQSLNEQLVGGVRRPPSATPVVEDDLTQIEGIGPRISALLKHHSIQNFAQLAETDVDRLRAILNEAGPSLQMASPDTWPVQARLAAAHEWDELRALQDRLTAGRED